MALSSRPCAFAGPPARAALQAAVHNRADRVHLRPARTAWVQTWCGSHDIERAASAGALARPEVGADLAEGAPVDWYP